MRAWEVVKEVNGGKDKGSAEISAKRSLHTRTHTHTIESSSFMLDLCVCVCVLGVALSVFYQSESCRRQMMQFQVPGVVSAPEMNFFFFF